jgi:ubiquinone biosynthesis protein
MIFQKKIEHIARFQQIIRVLAEHGFGSFIKDLRLNHLVPKGQLDKPQLKEQALHAKNLRLAMEELSGAFVKFGQLLSLRPDLVPEEYCNEFAKLQDNVPPFPSKTAKDIIEKELNKPLNKLFSHFEETPIAAASIGQVHKARLKTGQEIIVKVQRPDIEQKFSSDIDIMHHLANLIDSFYKPKVVKMKELVEEFERYTSHEMDYVKEANNINAFYNNFRHEKNIKIPKAYAEFTTKKVLVMDYIEGTKLKDIDKIKNVDKKKVLHEVVNAFFKQVFIDGFFHADPHPGNIFVLKNNKIAFIDFGIVGKIDPLMKSRILEFFEALIYRDTDSLAFLLMDMGFADYEVDKEKLKLSLEEGLGDYYNLPLNKIDFGEVFNAIVRIAKMHNIKLPNDFILLGKAILTIESVAAKLDPEFSIVVAGKPFVEKLTRTRTKVANLLKSVKEGSAWLREFVLNAPEKAREAIYGFRKTSATLRQIDNDITTLAVEMDKSSNRITYGLLIAALVVSSALLISYDRYLLFGFPVFSFIGLVFALLFSLILIWSIHNEKK